MLPLNKDSEGQGGKQSVQSLLWGEDVFRDHMAKAGPNVISKPAVKQWALSSSDYSLSSRLPPAPSLALGSSHREAY